MREILSDLVAEEQALDQFLQRVHEREWTLPTPARGWSIMDTVCHLAYSETFGAAVIEKGQEWIDQANIVDLDDWMERGITRHHRRQGPSIPGGHRVVAQWARQRRRRPVAHDRR
jgi:hypothetical protein